jgi:dihydroorotate dehydrogenase electron transfer subunit
MAQQLALKIVDQRAATARLRWLTLDAPTLARSARPGHYMLLRCAEPGSYDPLLRRALFVAAAEPALGQIGLLYEPDERGLAWLARGRPGDMLDVIGLLGQPFAVDERSRNLLLVGQGPGLAALLLLARAASARGCAVTLFAGAADTEALPPPFLLPGEVEYQAVIGRTIDLLTQTESQEPSIPEQRTKNKEQDDESPKPSIQQRVSPAHPLTGSPVHPLVWADQLFAALPSDQIAVLHAAIHAAKYRWARGFASALLEGPMVCGVGACGVCAIELRKRTRLLCSDGPVFDLRDIA